MFGFLPTLSAASMQNLFLVLAGSQILLIGMLVYLLVKQLAMQKKMRIFFSGKQAKDLESVLTEQLSEIKELDQEIQELFEISNRLRELGLKSLHKINIIRFNPFKEVGGNQSFSVVLLDGKNSGVVLSSLHTREGTRIYAKPILAGNTDGFPFTEEEKQAITQAINGKPNSL